MSQENKGVITPTADPDAAASPLDDRHLDTFLSNRNEEESEMTRGLKSKLDNVNSYETT